MRKLTRLGTGLVATAALLGVMLVGATPAQADDSSEYPSCTNFLYTGVGAPYGGGISNGPEFYAYSPQWTVSSSSACEDITIDHEPEQWYWRVRFYPSSGGSYVNSWKTACQLCFVLAATNVANGTKFRIEGKDLDNSVFARPTAQILF